MLATQISTVRSRDNIEELRRYVSLPVDEIQQVKRPFEEPYREFLCTVVQQIVDLIQPTIDEVKTHISKLKGLEFGNPSESGFRIAIKRLFDSTFSWPSQLNQYRMRIILALRHLQVYLHAFTLNELLPSRFANVYINDKLNMVMQANASDEFYEIYKANEEQLKEIAKPDKGYHKQILERLKSILITEYNKKTTSRTLIFAQTRCLAQYLSEYLNRCSQLKSFADDGNFSRAFTSSNQARKHGGMTSSDQQSILDAFNQGSVKVLVSTSVAEEGVDISACNLIIKYNTVGSELTLIQRRGRARALDSRNVLICLDSDVEKREIKNITREQLLHNCLMNLQAKSAAQLAADIEARRKEMHKIDKIKMDEQAEMERILKDKIYEVRSVLNTHYCCVDENVWKRIKIVSSEEPSTDEFIVKCGQFKCMGQMSDKECGQILGAVIRFADVFLPSIKHSSVVFQQKFDTENVKDYDKERISKLRWSDIQAHLFLVYPIKTEDLIIMEPSLRMADAKDYEQVKLEAAYAIQYRIEKIRLKKAQKVHFNWNILEDPDLGAENNFYAEDD